MARILAIGGSRFAGVRLVWHLPAPGRVVTILSRGRSADPFGPRVARLRPDRATPALRAAGIRAVAIPPHITPSMSLLDPGKAQRHLGSATPNSGITA